MLARVLVIIYNFKIQYFINDILLLILCFFLSVSFIDTLSYKI